MRRYLRLRLRVFFAVLVLMVSAWPFGQEADLRAEGNSRTASPPEINTKGTLDIGTGNPQGWGHVSFDDLLAAGEIDEGAVLVQRAKRKRRLEEKAESEAREALRFGISRLGLALADLAETFGDHYPRSEEFLCKLKELQRLAGQATLDTATELHSALDALNREALIANPLVSGQPILYVVRPQYKLDHHSTATIFQTSEINEGSFQGGGALKTIDFGNGGRVTTLLDIPEGIARDPDVSFDGKRLLFSMRRNGSDDYHIYEIKVDGTGFRQLTFGAGVSDIDPMYLPKGQIVFGSTREPKYCQCNRHIMANLFKMDSDGANIHQIGRNTLFEGHPSLMPEGRILYNRWEYVDKHFGPAFGLWTMNPDGTNQALYYGNNAWSPAAILDARIIPGTRRFIATFGSCHDRPWGAIVMAERSKGLDGMEPLIKTWPPDIEEFISVKKRYAETGAIDYFKRLRTKYEDPYPLSNKYFLCSRTIEGEEMGIFLLDIFGNEILLHRDKPGCYDPMSISPRQPPPTIPSRVDLARKEGVYYVVDVYKGDGMEKVQRGTIKYLRIVEAPPKLFWTHPFWNIDAQQGPAMNWNCTNNKRILGDVPVEVDGSAYFTVPADAFVFFQALDQNRMMIQSMRSATSVRPGEIIGCMGCHENRLTTVPGRSLSQAVRRPPSRIQPWYGPTREFNYLTEVQPVLDKHCVRCHDFGKPDGEKLNLAGDLGLVFNTSYLELRRKSATRWFPDPPGAEKILVKAVDDGPAELLPPYSWGSHRSKLVDVIRTEHYGLQLNKESFDRLVTWVDMNAPYYGSYASAYPENAFGRSPLNNEQLRRLSQLTGLKVGTQELEMQGSQVSFTRPELSPCLAKFEDKSDPRYKEALRIIQAGKEMLDRRPRADMRGFRLTGSDRRRQQKYDTWARKERGARRAILEGRKEYPAKGNTLEASRPSR
jgi:hypothetical protein